MKTTIATLVLLTAFSSASFAQSKSYRMLREKFSGTENVFSFRTSGFMARTILWMAGEKEFNDAIREVHSVRLTTIPKAAFSQQGVTVSGFRKLTGKEGFKELLSIRDAGDEITILQQTPERKNRDNQYLLILEESDEVVVIEVKGYIDPDMLIRYKNNMASN